MKESLKGAGKKETRQADRLLTKSVQEGRDKFGGKDVEARMIPAEKRHRSKRPK
jgi:hypothetical protein